MMMTGILNIPVRGEGEIEITLWLALVTYGVAFSKMFVKFMVYPDFEELMSMVMIRPALQTP